MGCRFIKIGFVILANLRTDKERAADKALQSGRVVSSLCVFLLNRNSGFCDTRHFDALENTSICGCLFIDAKEYHYNVQLIGNRHKIMI